MSVFFLNCNIRNLVKQVSRGFLYLLALSYTVWMPCVCVLYVIVQLWKAIWQRRRLEKMLGDRAWTVSHRMKYAQVTAFDANLYLGWDVLTWYYPGRQVYWNGLWYQWKSHPENAKDGPIEFRCIYEIGAWRIQMYLLTVLLKTGWQYKNVWIDNILILIELCLNYMIPLG